MAVPSFTSTLLRIVDHALIAGLDMQTELGLLVPFTWLKDLRSIHMPLKTCIFKHSSETKPLDTLICVRRSQDDVISRADRTRSYNSMEASRTLSHHFEPATRSVGCTFT